MFLLQCRKNLEIKENFEIKKQVRSNVNVEKAGSKYC
jgi:hypothetical protein